MAPLRWLGTLLKADAWGGRPGFRRTRALLVRGLGVAYLAAFGSLAVQVDGLVGSRGVLPAAKYLDAARRVLDDRACWRLPTVLWLDCSDGAVRAVCWVGLAAGLGAAAGLVPRVPLAVAWFFYLSLTVVGQEFLGYQWDILLLESGLLGVMIAPWGWWLPRTRSATPVAVVWLFRWLVFRLMFLSGWVKLASGDTAWRTWQALRYHYETQPLPTWTSWYLHQAPGWFHTASVGFMFWAELVAPFLILGPRLARRIACVSFALLMAGIGLTGNYGFFNALSIILCLSLLDDRDLGSPESVRAEPPPATDGGIVRRVRAGTMALLVSLVSLATTMAAVETVSPQVTFPWPLEWIRRAAEPFRSTNTYGLFAVMTTERREIVVEGSDDGNAWRPYRFRWKPCEPDRRPRFTFFHLPRLDWQAWFAALSGRCDAAPWFLEFERRLFEGSPAVLGLLRENPFPDRPPKYIRARLFQYRFSRPGDRVWWTREELGLFCPPLSARDLARP